MDDCEINIKAFVEFLGDARNEIEVAFCEQFEKLSKSATQNVFIKNALGSLRAQNEGGKRIRGAMIKLGEQIASLGTRNDYLPVAVSYELFQTAILIHDDIIDRAKTRRGKTTIHTEISERKKNDGIGDAIAEHLGASNAICVGDYGFFIASRILSDADIASSVLIEIIKMYSKIQAITCEGELIDVILPHERFSIIDSYQEYCEAVTEIYVCKTAWYTLAGPMILGAICGGGKKETIDLLKNIAMPLGIAFQIKDDLLGMYSSEDVIGKSVLSDITEKKQTLIYGYAYKNAQSEERKLLDSIYGKNDANMNDLETIRRIFDATGAKNFAEKEVVRLSAISDRLIENNLIADKHKALLRGLIGHLTSRSY